MTTKKDENGITITGGEYFDIGQTLDCGQTFRFRREEDGSYVVHSADKVCRIRESGDALRIDTSDPDYFYRYFALDEDYGGYFARLSAMPELKDACEAGRGIRLLRQDAFEMIISFIISANNNIPRIKGIIERLCTRCGAPLDDGYAFPTRSELLGLTVSDFTALGAGYRDSYLYSAVRTVTDEFLEELKTLSAQSARKMLLTVKGVGPKVADCIVLFGLGKRDSFPVDTWMKKALGSEELSTADKIHDFYLRRYGSLAGLAQQYIYNYARTRGQGSGS